MTMQYNNLLFPMKPQKLVRKYRLLKPHEKIQYGDVPYSGSIDVFNRAWGSVGTSTLLRVGINSVHQEGELPINGFVRFVDCVPARPHKPKTVRTENTQPDISITG